MVVKLGHGIQRWWWIVVAMRLVVRLLLHGVSLQPWEALALQMRFPHGLPTLRVERSLYRRYWWLYPDGFCTHPLALHVSTRPSYSLGGVIMGRLPASGLCRYHSTSVIHRSLMVVLLVQTGGSAAPIGV